MWYEIYVYMKCSRKITLNKLRIANYQIYFWRGNSEYWRCESWQQRLRFGWSRSTVKCGFLLNRRVLQSDLRCHFILGSAAFKIVSGDICSCLLLLCPASIAKMLGLKSRDRFGLPDILLLTSAQTGSVLLIRTCPDWIENYLHFTPQIYLDLI